MKIIILFFTMFYFISTIDGLSLTDEQKVKVKQYHRACLDETKVEPELVKKARKGTFTEDDKLKEFAFCFLTKANLVNSEGKLNEDVVMAKLPPGANKLGARIIMDVCKNETGKNPAETAFKIYKCYYEATPNHVSLI